jgi:pimeloyl-ACP methyl ester carboxylesterase
MALVQIGASALDVERSGVEGGPPLLLIMGMSGTALLWGEPFLDELRRDFDVIAFDHRGVGASTRLEGEITIADMADDAGALLDALGLDSVHVLGISMGGMIAQELALARPERVRTLTLGCSYCGGPHAELTAPGVLQRLSEAMSSGDRERAIRTGWEVNVSPSFAAEEEAWRRFLDLAERRAVAVPVVLAQMAACTAHDTHARLGGLDVPTLVVHGMLDEMLPVGNGRLLASLVPGAQLEVLEEIGHLFFWELPEHSAQLLRAHTAVLA